MDQVQKEIELLVSYLPILYAADFKPVKQWDGGYQEKPTILNSRNVNGKSIKMYMRQFVHS
ncbi:MAG: hypothetical protein U9N32_06195 [Spirochaetota bacterium]|nr:hypothetical protein [Spirochaetota bacterium]